MLRSAAEPRVSMVASTEPVAILRDASLRDAPQDEGPRYAAAFLRFCSSR